MMESVFCFPLEPGCSVVFYCLIAPATPCSAVSSTSGENRQSDLVPGFSEKTFQVFIMNYDVRCKCLLDTFYKSLFLFLFCILHK